MNTRGAMSERTTRMSPAEYRALREYLGLTGDAASTLLGVVPRQGRRWENGSSPVPAGVTAELGRIADDAHAAVAQALADAATTGEIVTYASDDALHAARPDLARYPASWHRAVAARALHAAPHLRIVYAN